MGLTILSQILNSLAEDVHHNLSGASNRVSVVATGVGSQRNQITLNYDLEQNYPNPFIPAATIRYTIPIRSHVSLSVYSALGQKVAELVNGEKDPGSYAVTFDA